MTRSILDLCLVLAILALPFGLAVLRYRVTGVRPSRAYGAHLMFLYIISNGSRMASGSAPSLSGILRTFGLTVGIWAVAVALNEWFEEHRQHASRGSA